MTLEGVVLPLTCFHGSLAFAFEFLGSAYHYSLQYEPCYKGPFQ
jgi:hypothetical protein